MLSGGMLRMLSGGLLRFPYELYPFPLCGVRTNCSLPGGGFPRFQQLQCVGDSRFRQLQCGGAPRFRRPSCGTFLCGRHFPFLKHGRSLCRGAPPRLMKIFCFYPLP